MTLATKLTLARFILVIPGLVLLAAEQYSASLGVFLVASLTDWADGYIARKTKTSSSLGAFLDPLADKLLVLLYFVFFVSIAVYPVWLFILMLAREIINDSFRNFAASRGAILPANIWGKIKTTFQMVSLISAHVALIFWGTNITQPVLPLALLANGTMVLALIAGIIGTVEFIRRNRSVLA